MGVIPALYRSSLYGLFFDSYLNGSDPCQEVGGYVVVIRQMLYEIAGYSGM